MTEDENIAWDKKGPGTENIPPSDPRYKDTGLGTFEKVTVDNLKGKEDIIQNPEDSEELDK